VIPKKFTTGGLTPLLLPALAIVLGALFVYGPVLHGDWLWDDDIYITQNPVLRSLSGLWRIWFAPRDVTYFPLTSSVEWIQWSLWGDAPFWYHVTNVVLHIASAFLIWRLLHLLGVKWAWTGGLLFAVHPIMVESVAWITELKNTLSLPLLLMAAIAYVRFDQKGSDLGNCFLPTEGAEGVRSRKLIFVPRGKYQLPRPDPIYLLSLLFFLLAMLAKSTAVMFPAVLLLYGWWKRGRIGRADWLASAPFFAVSLALGLLTVWFEQNKSIGTGVVLLGGIPSRLACAGLATSFYISKFMLPLELLPIYPRWELDPPSALQLLPLPLLAGILAWLWMKRSTWGRPALLGFGWFLLNVAPMAGLVPIGYMANSWVADHFVYLPAIGLVGLVAAAFSRIGRFPPAWICGGVALAVLACEGRAYTAVFLNQEAMWSYTMRHNPGSWLAHNNLGSLRVQQGRLAEGSAELEEALRINPRVFTVHRSLGNILLFEGRLPEAIDQYRQAIALGGGQVADMREKFGEALLKSGRIAEAGEQFASAVGLNSENARAHDRLGVALAMQGRPEESLPEFEASLRIDPGNAETHADLGNALFLMRQLQQAGEQYAEAVQLNPGYADAHANLGNVLYLAGRRDEAIGQYRAALQLNPGDPRTRAALDRALRQP